MYWLYVAVTKSGHTNLIIMYATIANCNSPRGGFVVLIVRFNAIL